MEKEIPTAPEALALSYLPPALASRVSAAAALWGGHFEELRLSLWGQAMLVCGGRAVRLGFAPTAAELAQTVRALCGGSLYAHADTIRSGFIFTAEGLRAGVCGRAVCRGGDLEAVEEITSLCLRVPRRIPAAADALLPLVCRPEGLFGLLIWSPPGVGKTTALRALAERLGAREPPLRVAVIDTRFELSDGGLAGVDCFRGYPSAAGMEIAVRTMSPDVLLCDEIAGEADASAVCAAAAAGVTVVATAHAGAAADLRRRADLAPLLEAGIFPALAGLRRQGDVVSCKITTPEGEGIECRASEAR